MGTSKRRSEKDPEVAAMVADPNWATQFPPLLCPAQAAALAQVPKQTIYTWSSQGRLDCCKVKVGKHLRILRDRFLKHLIDGGLSGD